MRILALTAGAAQMFCGSCLRDNSLARELIRQGHEVSLVPIYTPTRTDEPNASRQDKVLFGGISVYLQQKSRLFRHMPGILDRLWDSNWVLRLAAKRSLAVDPKELGALTVAMLEGEGGPLDKEFTKLESWLAQQPRPDVIQLPNTLLIAMAPAIRRVYDGPIVVTLQGEDLFLESLPEPYRLQSFKWIERHSGSVDAFVSISGFYASHMARLLRLREERLHVVPLGIDTREGSGLDFPAGPPSKKAPATFRVGYLARIAPEKGLHFLAEGWKEFRRRVQAPAQLEIAGYLPPEHRGYLESVEMAMKQAGFGAELHYHGELDRDSKVRFLRSLDVFSVPAVYDEPKGLYVLEALACGVPVVQPDRAVFREHLARCGGGLLFDAASPAALATHLETLYRDDAFRRELGMRGQAAVKQRATLEEMAKRTVEVYAEAAAIARRGAMAG